MLESVNKQSHIIPKRVINRFLFATLGEKLDEIPNSLNKKIFELTKQELLDDRAFSNLVSNVPFKIKKNKDLFYQLSKIALTRVQQGQQFTSSALLQRYHKLIKNYSQYPDIREIDSFIANILKHRQEYSINKSFIEGVLILIFRHLEIEKGILYALSNMKQQFKFIFKALKCSNIAKNRFKNWLNSQGRLVLYKTNMDLWQNFLTALDKDEIEDELYKMSKSSKYEKQDTRILKNFLALLPTNATVPEPQYLQGEWKKYLQFYEQLSALRNATNQYVTVPNHEINELETSLSKFSLAIPFIENLHQRWKQQWRDELERIKATQQTLQDKSTQNTEKLSQLVKNFFRSISTVGFVKGRFYRFIETSSPIVALAQPSEQIMLKLTAYEGQLNPKYQLPCIGHPLIDDEKVETYESYKLLGKNILPFKLCFYDDIEIKNNIPNREWDEIIDKQSAGLWLQIPVFYKEKNNKVRILGIFAFDWDGLPEEKFLFLQSGINNPLKAPQFSKMKTELNEQTRLKLNNINEQLYIIVRNISEAILAEEKQQEIDKLEVINELDKQLFTQLEGPSIEKILLDKAVRIVDASGGLLVSRELNGNDLIINQTYGHHQEKLKDIQLNTAQQSHPLIMAFNAKEPLYFPDWRNSKQSKELTEDSYLENFVPSYSQEAKEWLTSEVKSIIAFPIFSGQDEVIGAISLQSDTEYSFSKIEIDALKTLVERIRWFMYAVKLYEERRLWESALIHDLRNELNPIKQVINNIPNEEYYKNRGLLHCERLNTLTENFIKISDLKKGFIDNYLVDKSIYFDSAGKILYQYRQFYDYLLKRRKQKVNIFPDQKSPVWHTTLIGKEEIFDLILKNLLDNAFKYGLKNQPVYLTASINNEFWQLDICNKGAMTEQEYKNIFEAHKRTDRSKGVHIGLAFCKKMVELYGGKLIVENNPNENQVNTILKWPIKGR